MGFVYLLRQPIGTTKIGYTNSPDTRLKQYRTVFPGIDYQLLFQTDSPKQVETMLHKLYASRHVHGEWYFLTGKDKNLIAQIGDLPSPLEEMEKIFASESLTDYCRLEAAQEFKEEQYWHLFTMVMEKFQPAVEEARQVKESGELPVTYGKTFARLSTRFEQLQICWKWVVRTGYPLPADMVVECDRMLGGKTAIWEQSRTVRKARE